MKRTGVLPLMAAVIIGIAGCGGAEASTEGAAAGTASAGDPADVLNPATAAGRVFAAEFGEVCEGGRVGFEAGGVNPADFNGDGQGDYLVRMSHMTCDGEARGGMWCGTAGCSHVLLLSRGDTYTTQGFFADELEVVDREGGAVLQMPVTGGVRTMAWNGSEMAETR